MEKMPEYAAEELEAECLRLLRINASTREAQHVPIKRIKPKGSGPNWTWGEIEPRLTPIGLMDAERILANVSGRWALKD